MTPTIKEFDHERLIVYQTAIRFVDWCGGMLHNVPKSLAAHNQLDRASTSIPLNIAEGNGKSKPADRCKYFDISRGSALECAACLDVLVARKIFDESQVIAGKQMLVEIVSMLVGMIRSNSPDRNV